MSDAYRDLGAWTDIPEPLGQPSTDGSFTPGDWFVFSRIDGRCSLKEIFAVSGQSADATAEVLRKLYRAGCIRLPNADIAAAPLSLEQLKPDWETPFDEVMLPDELGVDASAVPVHLRKLVYYFQLHLGKVTYYQLLQVEVDVDRRTLEKHYYMMSKALHPDRWFRSEQGSLAPVFREVFVWLNRAFKTLRHPKRRAEYDQVLDAGHVGPWAIKEQRFAHRASSGTRSERPPETREELFTYGQRLQAQGRFADAADALRRALSGAKAPPEWQLELARVLVDGAMDLDEAHMRVRQVSRRDSGNYTAALLEARILRLKGRTADARSIVERLEKLDPAIPGLTNERDALEQ